MLILLIAFSPPGAKSLTHCNFAQRLATDSKLSHAKLSLNILLIARMTA